MKLLSPLIVLLFFSSPIHSQIEGPLQPETGPGGKEYVHEEVVFQDFAAEEDGYWLFEPASPRPDSAHLVVFIHGYGAINPMVYGQWIKHLVRRGNIVVFPRYQKNLLSPSPKKFAENAAKAIQDALIELDSGKHVRPIRTHLSFVGHSYGGAISAYLSARYQQMQIPQPKALMLCAPGTGPFKGGRLESYENIASDTKLLVIVHEGDRIVGDKLGVQVFETAVNTPQRNLLRQYKDERGEPEIYDGHNHAYALDTLFDAGIRNPSVRRAYRQAEANAMDFNGYWKLFDALLSCARFDERCEYALGNTPEQRHLGEWSDGTPIRELVVKTPEKEVKKPIASGQ